MYSSLFPPFSRTAKFNLVKDHLVEFNQVARDNADGSGDMYNRVQTKDNIALAVHLSTKEACWENGLPTSFGAEHNSQVCFLDMMHVH